MSGKKVVIDEKAVLVKDTVAKFGFGQVANPTPPMVTNVFRITKYAQYS